jgi:2-keto-4-pentenoate hydratase/2-oxohepta-3-ene-1,7-dioic acid hydratase in catechol pathway
MTEWPFAPGAVPGIAVDGTEALYPPGRIFCVGRNYAAHAAETGNEVDRAAPFDFTRSAVHLAPSGGTVPYPPGITDYRHEMAHSVPGVIADLSRFCHLRPDGVILTGAPGGVGAAVAGDVLRGVMEGLRDVEMTVGPAA